MERKRQAGRTPISVDIPEKVRKGEGFLFLQYYLDISENALGTVACWESLGVFWGPVKNTISAIVLVLPGPKSVKYADWGIFAHFIHIYFYICMFNFCLE